MILSFDIGNTNVAAGLYSGGRRLRPVSYWKLRRPRRADRLWWRDLAALVCAEAGVPPRRLEGCAVSSVVPQASRLLADALKQLTGKEPLMVRGGLPLGITPAYADPDRLGPDRACAMLAAVRKIGAPVVVVDCGTAITIDGVTGGKRHIGGMISPGIAMSASALGASTAALPEAEWGVPLQPAGTDTVSCIRSGVWFGAVGGIREGVKQLRAALGGRAKVVGTGGDARVLMKEAGLFDTVDPTLVLEGAALAWGLVHAKGPGRGTPKRRPPAAARPGASTLRRQGAKR